MQLSLPNRGSLSSETRSLGSCWSRARQSCQEQRGWSLCYNYQIGLTFFSFFYLSCDAFPNKNQKKTRKCTISFRYFFFMKMRYHTRTCSFRNWISDGLIEWKRMNGIEWRFFLVKRLILTKQPRASAFQTLSPFFKFKTFAFRINFLLSIL